MLQAGVVTVDYVVDEYDHTALFYAAHRNRNDVIRLLLQNGADVNKRNRLGITPVHYTARYNKTEGIACNVDKTWRVDQHHE